MPANMHLGAGRRPQCASTSRGTTASLPPAVRAPTPPCRGPTDPPCTSGGSSATRAAACALATAALAVAAVAGPPPAAALTAAVQQPSPLWEVADVAAMYVDGGQDAAQALDQEADLSEEIEQPQELYDLLNLFANGTPTDEAQLAAARLRAGFRRSADGRVAIHSGGGDWFSVKNDGLVPGFLLLRDDQGYCFYLPPDQAGALAQVDLSDDLIVAQLFANRMWEQLLEPLEALSKDTGTPTQLRMGESEFRATVSLLDGAIPGEEQALPPLDE